MEKTSEFLQGDVHCRGNVAKLTFLLLILVNGCTPRPAPIPLSPMWGIPCEENERLAVARVDDAPYVRIPDSVDCTLQLLSMPDKTTYVSGEDVMITAMVKMHGTCTWKIWTSFPMRDFDPIVIADKDGNDVSLTERGQELRELAKENLEYDNPRLFGSILMTPENRTLCLRLPISEWFDLSASGTYSLTLIRKNPGDEPGEIPSNPVTFTRLP